MMIAALQTSVDGRIEGPNGELDWIGDWNDDFGIRAQVDTCLLGGGMYPGYESYWSAIQADPTARLEFTGRPPTQGEIEYAEFAAETPHVVLSSTLPAPAWATTRVVNDIGELAALKRSPGKGIFVVGGATLVSSLMNLGLIDELRLVVHPLVLGDGLALFKDVGGRHPMALVAAEHSDAGVVALTYRVLSEERLE